MTMIEVELGEVTKRFGEVVAVENVSLKIKDGEFFSLLGPSGCGKTTILRMIAGFEQPTAGRIYLKDQQVEGLPPHKRPVNTVFQNYALFPHLTVAENVGFGLAMQKLSRAEITRRVQEGLEMVRLADTGRRKPHQLSGGQQQRIALARALVNRPEVLLLDEPLSALDLKLRQAMQLELKQLQQQLGITFIFVTHDQEEALTMSDRIGVMNQGHLLQVGTPAEIYEQPANRFVADFIGETNILPCRITGRDEGLATVAVGERWVTQAVCAPGLAAGQMGSLIVRPEKIVIESDPISPEGHGPALPGVISEALYLGTSTRFAIKLADGTTLNVLRQNKAVLDSLAQARRGETVYLSWPATAARVLVS